MTLSRTARARMRICSAMIAIVVMLLCVSGAAADAYDAAHPEALTNADLTGAAALVMDMDSDTVLYARNIDRQTPPASITKVMTCLVALEHSNLDDIVTVTREANDIPWDSSKLDIKTGEQFTMADLLYGMMIKSGNDASIAIAIHVAGSVTDFVDMMNEKAQELGCTNTTFKNPHGYHEAGHLSTARDLATIGMAAMRNQTFREIVSSKSHTLAATNLRERRRLETENSMFVASSKFFYPELIGIKTGTHSKAGYCFLGAAERDGMHLISVTLRSDITGRWTDTRRLMDYGFSCFQTYSFDDMYEKAPIYASITNAARNDPDNGVIPLVVVPGGSISSYTFRCLPDLFAQGMQDFSNGLTVHYTKELKAPIYEGDILGTVSIDTGETTLSGTLIASRDVAQELTPFSLTSLMPTLTEMLGSNLLYIILGIIAFIILLIILLRIRVSIRNNRRRKEMLRRKRAAYDRYRNR